MPPPAFPIPQQPWRPEMPMFEAPTTTTVKPTTTTEFAYVDIDSLIGEVESATTKAPSDEVNAFGGLDIGSMVGGFLVGFASPVVTEKPAPSRGNRVE